MFSSLQHSLGRHSLFDLTCSISSAITICVRDRPCFIVFRIKIEQNLCVVVKFNAILRYWRFMQIRQIIFNCTDMQIMPFIIDKILKLLTYDAPFYHQLLLSYLISKTVRFLAHPVLIRPAARLGIRPQLLSTECDRRHSECVFKVWPSEANDNNNRPLCWQQLSFVDIRSGLHLIFSLVAEQK